MTRSIDNYASMDHVRLAELAFNQCQEIARLHELREVTRGELKDLRRALGRRRLEVADLRERLGLSIDSRCAAEIERERARAEEFAVL